MYVSDALWCSSSSMQVLSSNGVNAFLNHFYSELESKAVPLFQEEPQRRNITALRNRAVASKLAYEKRQTFQKKATLEAKKRTLDLSLRLEKFEESGSRSGCHCDTCAYLNLRIPVNEHGPIGFLYSAGIEETCKKHLYLTKNFSMAHLCHRNMLGELDCVYGGVSFPSLYLGTSHSTFPIHVEDLSLWSFNFILKGFPKLW